MSQILQTQNRSRLYQDMFFAEKTQPLNSQVIEASCYVCGKGIKNGYSVTAKNTPSGIILYCNRHYS